MHHLWPIQYTASGPFRWRADGGLRLYARQPLEPVKDNMVNTTYASREDLDKTTQLHSVTRHFTPPSQDASTNHIWIPTSIIENIR